MKTIALISTLAFCARLTATAQGVHLNAGEALSFGFNGVDGCHPFDGGVDSTVRVLFGNNLLGPGESMRLEMFADSLADPAFATQVFSPSDTVPFVQLTGPVTGWLDYQGLVRVTMLNGSVDVLGGRFFVDRTSQYCDAVVAVPEPDTKMLILLGIGSAWLYFAFIRRERCETHVPRLP